MSQKITTYLLSIFCLINLAKAQSIDTEQVFSNLHGIKDAFDMKRNRTVYYEVEGYNIYVGNTVAALDEKGLQKIKRQYKIDPQAKVSSIPEFSNSKILFHSLQLTPEVKQSKIYYLTALDNNVKVILLQTFNERDEQLEKLMVKSILEDKIPNEVFTTSQADSINFAGRSIRLGSACDWIDAHNIQCPYLGQMNWAEFSNQGKAEDMIKNRLAVTQSKSIGQTLQQDTINVVFEGQETQAIKLTYKLKVPKIVTGGSNVLIVYYVATKVRDKYIACVLSHYTNEAKVNELPKLLALVMKLK